MATTGVALFVALLALATIASGVCCLLGAARDTTLARAVGGALALLPALAVAAYLRYGLLPPHHAMYLDEPWYAEAACSLAGSGRAVLCAATWSGVVCDPYEKALGWPVVLAPWAMLAGCGTAIGIGLNRLIGTATILLAAAATRCAGGRWWQAAVAAAIVALHPTHVAWSVTGETNVPAAAALLAGVCGVLRYQRRGDRAAAVLAVAGFGLATAMRPESLLAALLAAPVLAVAGPAAVRQRRRVAAALAGAAVAAALSALPLWSMNAALSGGAFLSPANIPPSLLRVADGAAARVHLTLLVLAVVGAVALARRQPVAAPLILVIGLGMTCVVLAYDRFDERMLLAGTVLLAPLAGCAAAARGDATGAVVSVALMALIGWWWAPPLRRLAVPETQLLETRLAVAAGGAALPPEALVVAPQPAVLGANGTPPAMALDGALGDAARLAQRVVSGRPTYFLCDMFCEPGFVGGTAEACGRMLSTFSLTAAVEEAVPGRTYGLYRLSPRDPAVPPPGCPRMR
jgi:hypothetical protein